MPQLECGIQARIPEYSEKEKLVFMVGFYITYVFRK
jgi:hypothetical protein